MANQTSNSSKAVLTIFSLAMINVVAIASVRNLPMMAEYGVSVIFYVGLCAIVFFIPMSLVSAELATGWPKKGGVYLWVKEGFGPRWGFLAIWLQWVENVAWFPTALSFAAATFAYAINPHLASNKMYTLTIILVAFWGATFLNFRGMKLSARISSSGAFAGTIIPGGLIILLGILWLVSGKASQISFTREALLPSMGSISQLVLLTGVLLSLAGMEMSAVHAREVKNPRRDFPKAILFSAVIIIAIFILGALAIAIVIPQKEISLVAGVMEAFEKFFSAYNIRWLVPFIAIMVGYGALAQVSTWIVGPTKGLSVTAETGDLPPYFQKVNKHGMPTNILIVQAAIVTIFSLVFLFMPTVSSSYWILTVLCSQVYLIMYLLMFAAAIRLRYTQPDVPRAYKVPGGTVGMWVVGGLGFLAALFAICIGFVPPAQVKSGSLVFFEAFLILGILVMTVPPLLIYRFRKASWAPQPPEQQQQSETTGH